MYAAILANVARHITLLPAEDEAFTACLVPMHVARHGHILPDGPPARYLAFVVRGCVRTYATDARGKEHVLAFAPEGWWCGNFTSVVPGPRAPLTSQALEDSDVLLLRLDHLEQLCAQVPKFERFFRLLFQNGYLLAQRRLEARHVHRRRALRPLLPPVSAAAPAGGPQAHCLLFGHHPRISEYAAQQAAVVS